MEVPYPLISDIEKKRCLPFIGAGFSKNAALPLGLSMPDWAELTSILAEHAKTPERMAAPAVAERYQQMFGRVQLIETIRDALYPDKGRPGRAHRVFVQLPFDTIYTTNFDLLLEEAYSEETRPFRSLVGELQLPFHAGQAASTIIKMHGDLRHEEHIIVTQTDYDSFLSKYPVIATHLSAMLITRTPLFIGYSLSDPDFENIRRIVRSRLGAFERMGYIVQFDVPAESAEAMLGDNLHVISLPSDSRSTRDEVLASFFHAIQEALDTKAGTSLRASRPDIFEEVKADVIQEAVRSADQSSIAEATSRLCFVLMPFGDRFDALYRTVIAPAVSAQGFTALRADELAGSGFVMEQIRSGIQQARFCMADLTTGNPNVLYEVGIATAVGKPMLFLAEKGSKLPFDLAHQRVIFYEPDLSNLTELLTHAINLLASQDRLPEAARLFDMGLYRASIASSAIALELRLRSMLSSRQTEMVRPVFSLKRMVEALSGLKDKTTSSHSAELLRVAELRNQAVHGPKEPAKADADFVLQTVRSFLDQTSEVDSK
jgi:hypothetical protein